MKKKILSLVLTFCFGCAMVFAAPSSTQAPSDLFGDHLEYDANTGQMTAEGHVVMISEDGKTTSDFATYNINSQTGTMRGNVIADKKDMHLDCDMLEIFTGSKIIATGNVHAKQADKSFSGLKAEYTSETGYIVMPSGGTVTSTDGQFSADFMEGWINENHYRGVGNTHIISQAKNFEGGGDQADYFGEQSGKLVLTGNAWGIQENHRLHGQVITVFLKDTNQSDAAK